MRVYKTDKHSFCIAPGKKQIRVHLPIHAHEWLKSHSTTKGLGQLIVHLIESYQDRQHLERLMNSLTGDVKRALCQTKEDETVKNA